MLSTPALHSSLSMSLYEFLPVTSSHLSAHISLMVPVSKHSDLLIQQSTVNTLGDCDLLTSSGDHDTKISDNSGSGSDEGENIFPGYF